MSDGGWRAPGRPAATARRAAAASPAPAPTAPAIALPARAAFRSVHTFGMRFPLDLVWLGRRGRVLRVDHDVRPSRVKLCVRARSVVETYAGQGDRFARALSDDA